MSRLEELIKELCPDGVEFASISNCVEKIKNIKWIDNKDVEFQYIDLTSVDRETSKITETQTINANNAPSRAQQILQSGDVILGTTRPMLKRYCLIGDEYNNQICSTGFCVLRANESIALQKWIYYQIASSEFFTYVEKYQKGASYPAISDAEVKSFKIPLPPLPVQREIVRILDNFTELTAELTAELTERKKQYEYYRNELLTFSGTVPRVILGDVSSIYDGTHKTPKYKSEGVRFVSVENISALKQSRKYISTEDYEKLYKVKPQKNDVFMTRIGSIGVCAVVEDNEPLAYYVTLTLIRPNQEHINSRFLKHALESIHGKDELRKRTLIHATPIKINLGEIGKISIPLPSLEEQERIVAILDRFDALCNDLTIGLPAEIEARRKQYEYYRDKLLTFKEVSK